MTKQRFTNIIILLLSAMLFVGMLQQEPQEPEKIQTWKLPVYMQENLQWMLNDFNRRFEEKVTGYKKELRTRFTEFKDMPEDVVLYLEGGVFMRRADFLKLQKQQQQQIKKKGGEGE